jgi:uncharacterized protein
VQSHAERRGQLDALLRRETSVLVAYSGGVDSSALLVAAVRALGAERVLAVTADSPSLPAGDRRDAAECAAALGVRHLFVKTDELSNPLYAANGPNRCYFCKSELFGVLEPLRRAHGLDKIAYGEIVDDAGEFRPGRRAAQESGVLAPLRDAGFTKDDARALLAAEGFTKLSVKPASACLASRIPHGTPVNVEVLGRVGDCEEFLRARGYGVVRVRHHDAIARLELDAAGIARAVNPAEREAILAYFTSRGFRFVALDLAGYRAGSLSATSA